MSLLEFIQHKYDFPTSSIEAQDNNMKYYFFNVHLCNYCKSKESFNDSKLCSGCKLISYCSSEHQKADWKSHKGICKAAQSLCGIAPANDVFDAAYILLRRSLKCLGCETVLPDVSAAQAQIEIELNGMLELPLNRDLSGFERNMIYYPRRCTICFTRKNISKELVCTKCFSAAYCSREHQRQDKHEDFCPDFQKVIDVNLFMLNTKPEPREVPFIKPEQVINLKLGAYDMKRFISNYISPGSKFEEEAMISFYYTSVLTVAYIINRIPNFTLHKILTIHVVGASPYYEGLVLEHWENLLHLFPKVDAVTIVHIGPCIGGDRTKLKLCDACNTANRSMDILFYNKLYHEYYESSCDKKKPDVIVAFNTGLYTDNPNYKLWEESLPFFFRYENVPIILTEASETEMERDLGKLLSPSVRGTKKVNVIVKSEENPFKNLKPYRCVGHPKKVVLNDNAFVSALVRERS